MMNNNHNFLHSYFLNNSDKIIHKWLHYFDIYERYFRKYVGKNILMIEIGVFQGGSLDMWKEYFGEKVTIVGIDIDPNCKIFENKEKNVFIEIGDQSDINFLKSVVEKYGKPDIVLDDGSHIMEHISTTFDYLYYIMNSESTYMVEDLHCSYWNEYQGGFRLDGTFIEFAKKKVDEINAIHSRGAQDITEFTKITQSIHFYDSIVVFEKRLQSKKSHIMTGNMSIL
jgi:hypothetical protein